MYTLPGMDWTLFQRLSCLSNSGLQISQTPHKATSCEGVSRSSESVALLPCSLEGIALQLWTWTRHVTKGLKKWPTGMTCALRQEWCTPGICQMIDILVTVSWQIVYWLQPSYQATHFWEHSVLFVWTQVYWGYSTCDKIQRFKSDDKCKHYLNKDRKQGRLSGSVG